ncbi:MAG TPA: MoaD/ThiS family protein [Candidatus Methylomirabilis sp.]|nr:MoaD/ThiS family protein [Candidatus Methylomirabilis sp.]
MPQATFWFASPFKEWIGRRSLTLSWEGQASLREIFVRLAADYPRLRANLPPEGLQDERMNHMLAVILDGDFLSLDSIIPDGAKVDVLTPLSGGTPLGHCDRGPIPA